MVLTLSPEPGRYSIVQEITQTIQGRSSDGDIPVQTTLLTVVYQLNEQRSPSPTPSSSTASPASIHNRYTLASCNVRFFQNPVSTGLTFFEQSGYMQDLPISPVSATFSENGDHVGSYLSSDCMTHLQETTYPQIPSLPMEDTFNPRWGGYVPPTAEPLM